MEKASIPPAFLNLAGYTQMYKIVEPLAVFRPAAYKTALFKGCSFKTEVLKEPQYTKNKKAPFFHKF
jgi:hypothetical protein